MTLAPQTTILEERLRGGQTWSRVLRRGQVLRLTDVEGGSRNWGTTAMVTLNVPLFEGHSDYRNYRREDTSRIASFNTS